MDPIQRDMELLSSSMATYAYIQANPESFALYFMMGVCFGLLLALCLLVTGVACTPRRHRPKAKAPPSSSSPERRQLKLSSEEEEDESTGEDDDGEGSEIPKVTVVPCMTSTVSSQSTSGTLQSLDVFASAEELERARRLEERERIVREIWRNGQPDILVTGTGTIGRVHYH